MRTVMATLAILLSVSVAADFDAGLAAYDAGDYETAFNEFKPLAEQGDAAVQFNFGRMYYRGEGVLQDYKEAAKWYTKAAQQGFYKAQSDLGLMYFNGEGVVQNNKEAVKWFAKAAEQGNAQAQYNLGYMYAKGKGVLQDFKQAAKWYTKAAEQGDAMAQGSLGLMYAKGEGVPQDDVYAYMWWSVAWSNGNEIGRDNKGIIAEQMTPDKVAEAQRLAGECVKKDYKGCVIKKDAYGYPFAMTIDEIFTPTDVPLEQEAYEVGYLRCSGLLMLLGSQALSNGIGLNEQQLDERINTLGMVAALYGGITFSESMNAEEVMAVTSDNFNKKGKHLMFEYGDWINALDIRNDAIEQDNDHPLTKDQKQCEKLADELIRKIDGE